jgi:hypothetical protein
LNVAGAEAHKMGDIVTSNDATDSEKTGIPYSGCTAHIGTRHGPDVVDTDGTGLTRLTNDPTNDGFPQSQPPEAPPRSQPGQDPEMRSVSGTARMPGGSIR